MEWHDKNYLHGYVSSTAQSRKEYPWHDWNAVLRHNDNNKWYGVVLEVSADKLGLPEVGIIDVLNVKSDPLLIGSLRRQDGYFPAYHMNKEKWLSIQLGKPELDDAIKDLLSLSHELTAPKKMNKYYEDLSEKYRKMIPLKRVYIPVTKEDAE